MSYISDKYNTIYIVNPKTASMSFREKLIELNFNNIHILNNRKDLLCHPYKLHQTAIETKDVCNKLNINYESYFKFTIIRNPFEKMVSLYFFHKYDKNMKPFFEKGYDGKTSFFYDFNTWLLLKKDIDLYFYTIENFAFENGKQIVDKIYKLENLNINDINEDINNFNKNKKTNNIEEIKLTLLDKKNSTNHGHYTKYYNENSINIIKEVFKLDIEIGSYQYDNDSS
jgi:hypothetical protein